MKSINLKKTADILFFLIIAVFILVVISFRIKNLLNVFPFFWCDEAWLFANVHGKTFLECFSPLIYDQCCPPVFLILSKLLSLKFGLNEFVLRLFSCFVSVLSIFSFVYLSLEFFKRKISVLFANILFLLSYTFAFYSINFKHYSFDCLVSVVTLILILKFRDKVFSNWQILLLSLGTLFLFFCSYPSIILVISALAALFLNKYKNNIKNVVIPAGIYFLPLIAVLSFFVYHTCLPMIKSEYLQTFWSVANELNNNAHDIFFIPSSVSDVTRLFLYFFGASPDTITNCCSGRYLYLIFILFAGIFGYSVYLLYKNDKFLCYFFILPYVFAFILGMLHIYPFSATRVSIYLIPVFILTVIYIFEKTENIKSLGIWGIVFSLMIFKFVSFNSFGVSINPDLKAPFVKALVSSDISKDDCFLYGSYEIYSVYDKENKLAENMEAYKVWDLETIPQGGNIYLYKTSDDKFLFDNAEILQWLSDNCEIIYSQKDDYGILVKLKRIK